ncbi:3-keto-5-aminohexanoate cleavage protein [Saccharopolyspora sp. CA-218241]|uniref:3-keto-5-aminohexanoate cleavage protein n=1 Tax=Saccharopolyspora sp. CA-218241 TaxID=3240027 RepID=UPI003D9857C9
MLQACLNGARSPREHYQLPVRPEQLARAAADAVTAGADEIHLHPKAHDGTDSLDPHLVAAALRTVRAAVPRTPVGITTSTWSTPDAAARIRALRAWTALPDHATVDWHEPGAADVTDALLRRGIAVHAVVPSGTDAHDALLRSPLRDRITRVVARVTDPTGGATTTAAALRDRLRPLTAPVLLHGTGPGAWTVLALARRGGGPARIGLEDTLVLPDGRIADDTAALVTAALAPHHRRRPDTPTPSG